MPLLTANGFQLSYSDHGHPSGLPVVFIHGFPFGQAMWQKQAEALKDRFRVITYDLRGHGQSEVGDGQYLIEFFVDDLMSLLDALKIDKAVLCGLSMGGYIALRAVERNPERVRALVLCDTRSEADSNEVKLRRSEAIKTIHQKGVPFFAEGFLKALFTPQNLSPEVQGVEAIRRLMQANPTGGLCGALIALAARTDTTASLPKIAVPTLILVGEQDIITPPAAARAMQAAIPGARLEIIPEAGHLSSVENPEAFNRHLLGFLKSL